MCGVRCEGLFPNCAADHFFLSPGGKVSLGVRVEGERTRVGVGEWERGGEVFQRMSGKIDQVKGLCRR